MYSDNDGTQVHEIGHSTQSIYDDTQSIHILIKFNGFEIFWRKEY